MKLSFLGVFVSNFIFPSGMIIDLPNLDLEMMQHYSKQWNLEHSKMEKGSFIGNIKAVHTPRIQLASAYYSKSFMSRGDFPKGCIVLIYSPNDVMYSFQNQSILGNEIIVLKSGDVIDILTSGQINVRTIVIEEKLFYQTFYNFFDDTPHEKVDKKRFSIKADMVSVFHQTVHSWSTYLVNDYPALKIKPDYEKIEHEILHQLFNCIQISSSNKKRKKFQTKTVRDLFHENLEKHLDILTISKELNISERQLYYTFKNDYGITPKQYFQYLRFNAIKKELLFGHPHVNTVSGIAKKYNIFHMGHFTAEYKKLFGETPFQTLNSKL